MHIYICVYIYRERDRQIDICMYNEPSQDTAARPLRADVTKSGQDVRWGRVDFVEAHPNPEFPAIEACRIACEDTINHAIVR